MKILLVHAHSDPYITAGRYKKFLRIMPPISLAYVAAAAEKAGHEVKLFDDALLGGDKALLEKTIKEFKPDLAGLSVVTPSANGCYQVAESIRHIAPEIKIVMGNIHADIFHSRILKQGLCDIVVRGEGELTFPDLLNALSSGQDLASVQGISFLMNGELIDTPDRPFISNLDKLPFPAWHLFPIEKYRIFQFAEITTPASLIQGSRGCPYGCSYCCLKIMGRVRRVRTPQNICDEIEIHHDRYGYRQISFTDPIFPLTKQEGLEFAHEMIKRGLNKKVVWITETRVDLVDLELLEALAASGCRRIMYGFEAGDEQGLEAVKKGADLDQARKAVALTRKAGIQIVGFFMLGVPGETVASAKRTIEFAKELDLDFAKFTAFVPFPGTPIYNDLLASNNIEDTEQWERYSNYPTPDIRPIYIPKDVTHNQLIALQRKAFADFYIRPKMIWKHFVELRSLKISDAISGLGVLFSK